MSADLLRPHRSLDARCLWTGTGLAAVATAFLIWARWRPLGIEATEDLSAPPA